MYRKLDDMLIVQAACEMSDDATINFEEAFNALKATSCCKPWAIELIKQEKEEAAEKNQIRENISRSQFECDKMEEEDLYS